MVDWDSQSGARRRHSSRGGTVPTIVPATCKYTLRKHLRIRRIFLTEANFGGVFPKNRRLPAKPRNNNNFRNSTIADRGDRLGTLLGTARNRHVKSGLYDWTDLCRRTPTAVVCPRLCPPTDWSHAHHCIPSGYTRLPCRPRQKRRRPGTSICLLS